MIRPSIDTIEQSISTFFLYCECKSAKKDFLWSLHESVFIPPNAISSNGRVPGGRKT
ncbi:unnamed protein product [Nesidiocoris tenuis]|uniref:Uncharacterized protein n=1 Tax=Nesidiocoris tenuis TaxID=355587 RepID=A0A6H5HCR4_9HEMI|nr:unnamed protein product [Nesidiocoris tenuis]